MPIADHVDDAFDPGMETVHERLHQLHPGLLRGRRHLEAVSRIEGERLFAENMLSRSDCVDHPIPMQAVREWDIERVDIGVVNQVFVRAVGSGDAVLSGKGIRAIGIP